MKNECFEVSPIYSADERQAKMRMMLARMREPEYQTDVDVADAVIERVAVADADNKRALETLKNAPSTGIVEAVEKAKKYVASTNQELVDVGIEYKRLRGDYVAPRRKPLRAVRKPKIRVKTLKKWLNVGQHDVNLCHNITMPSNSARRNRRSK